MKGRQGNNRPHDVPLSFQAINLLSAVYTKDSNSDDLIFSSTGKPLSGMALRKVIRKLDAKMISSGFSGFRDESQSNRVAVTHGFRAAFATWAQESEEAISVIEHCLAHVDSTDKHNGAYRRGRMIGQRKELLQRWADYCFSQVIDDI